MLILLHPGHRRPTAFVADEEIKAKEPLYGAVPDLSAIKADMRDIRERLAKIETRLYHLPTKDFVMTAAIVIIGLIGAIITLQQQIQGWIGIIPHR